MLVHRFDPLIPLPVYGSTHAAGFDLHLSFVAAPVTKHVRSQLPTGFEEVDGSTWRILPGRMAYARLGLGFKIPAGHFLDIRGRSGWTGAALVVLPGTVDEDYIGEVGAHVVNLSQWAIPVTRGMRIAQAVLLQRGARQDFHEDEEAWASLSTERGAKGFGSSGA